jgi:hypothetical protein
MQLNGRGTLVKELRMGDVEDPYLYAAFPIHEWEQSEEYHWIKQQIGNKEMVFYCDNDPANYGFKIRIYAPLEGQALTYYNLKYLGIKE